jgi:predicted ribosomally synthesized peptide with SipW-like signal peptide
MKKKTKVLLSSLLAISMSASLATGATYALFTSTSSVNVSVTAGKVDVKATIDEESLKTYSMDVPTQVNGTFENGGIATFEGQNATLELINVTPEDSVSFNIDVTNYSNVNVQYRLVWAVEGKLAEALTATVDYTPEDKTDEVVAIVDNVSAWTAWNAPANGSETKTMEVVIDFPDAEDNNEYQGKSANIAFTVEAIQGNASVANTKPDNSIAEGGAQVNDLQGNGAKYRFNVIMVGVIFTEVSDEDKRDSGRR